MAIKKESAGWETLPEVNYNPSKMTRGIMMDIVGLEGSGKSSLALTLARCGQVGYVDIDQSIDRAKRPDGKKNRERIKLLPVRYSAGAGVEGTKLACREAWDAMESNMKGASSSWADGMVIDTDTEAWELKRLAAFGTVTPQGRTDRLYGPVNAQFRQMHRDINRVNRKHLVTIHHLKDEYVDKMKDGQVTSVKSGKYVRSGWKEIGMLADIIIKTFYDGDEFKATIEICKMNPAMQKMELSDDQLDFATIVAMATETEPKDWWK